MAIVRRDVSDGLYRPWTFFMAKHLAFWPLILPEAILVTAVTFSSVTLNLGPAGESVTSFPKIILQQYTMLFVY